MTLSTWLREFRAGFGHSGRRKRLRQQSDHKRKRTTQLQLEVLEDRVVPSTAASLLKDVNPGADSSSPAEFVESNGIVFFTAGDSSNGVELWKTDGTTAGTMLIKDINPGSGSSNPDNLTDVNGTLFFTANDGTNFTELWKSDGTAAGTMLVKNISVGGASNPSWLTNVNGTLFFSAESSTSDGTELWKSDGTAAGTVMVKDINPSPNGDSRPGELTNVNGTLFFGADDGTNGIELWKSDGTAAGTVLVKDINPGSSNSRPSIGFFLTNVNGTLFFGADDGSNGAELWKSDGTMAGTVLIKDINPGFPASSSPEQLINVNGTLFFGAQDTNSNGELWKSDGTPAGTVLVEDITPSTSVGRGLNAWLTDVNGTLFFVARDGNLWKSNGTAASTMLVKKFGIGNAPIELTVADGRLFFSAVNSTNGRELWTSDGTATVRVTDINPGTAASNPSSLTNINGTLYFSANDGTNGIEPWTLDTDDLFTTTDIEVDPDKINVNSNGSITLTLFTTTDFDAALVDVSTVDFAGAAAFQSDLVDVDNDGDLDLVLHFDREDTMLSDIYAQLVEEDLDGDGVLDSRNQEATVSMAGLTTDGELFEGHEALNLSLSGKALRDLLDEIYGS